ncbi:MAG: acyl-CoA dehydrogenase family protein [Myxococcota bacterium]|nr:acyl-CoA dehydrogenase family protein [Myxococcota bacterium]
MRLILDDTQTLLQTTAREWVSERSPVGRVRDLRAARDPVGYSPTLWQEMASLGWAGVHFPEELGGAGLGFFDLCLVLEAVGRRLMPEPFVSSVLLGAGALLYAGSPSQQDTWLPKVASGEATLALGFEEAGSRYNHHHVGLRAARSEGGYALSGEKVHVLDGGSADALLVSARLEGERDAAEGLGLFLVEAEASGMTCDPQWRVDGRGSVVVRLEGVQVPESSLVGEPGRGGAVLDWVMDRACIGLAAEMLGASTEAFDVTVNYLREREQFGQPIGGFQALQHRAARLLMELEMARSAVLGAARAVDEGSERISELASLAKARCADVVNHVTNEAVQMHGGIGMTDEHDIGFFMKRARAAGSLFGDAAWHRERWAALRGY